MQSQDLAASAPLIPRNKAKFLTLSIVVTLAALLLLAYFLWFRPALPPRNALLLLLPEDAQSVLFIDLSDLRRSPFFADLLASAPHPDADPNYLQFVRDTGFDYEKDLKRVAIAFQHQGAQQTFFAVADGQFEQKKIKAYAAKNGVMENLGGAKIYSLPVAESSSRISFTFLNENRIAFTNNRNLTSLLHSARSADSAQWQTRFERVAGVPVFGVIRSDGLKAVFGTPSASQDFTRRATGGLSSPQLSLLAQLQWVTIAAKPENDKLRVVADGESLEDRDARQLADLLNGVVLLARAGLSGASTQQIAAATRQSYLALLNSVEVSRIDRGETKSVRLMFDVTPTLLKTAPSPAPAALPGHLVH